jgi:hypothetical protein
MATVKQVVGRAYHDYLQKGFGNHPPSEAMWVAEVYMDENKNITEEQLYQHVYDTLMGTDG